jgi:hypothetical protein
VQAARTIKSSTPSCFRPSSPSWTMFPVLPPPSFRGKSARGTLLPATCTPRFSSRSWLVFFKTGVSGRVFHVLLEIAVWLRRVLRSERQRWAVEFQENTRPHVCAETTVWRHLGVQLHCLLHAQVASCRKVVLPYEATSTSALVTTKKETSSPQGGIVQAAQTIKSSTPSCFRTSSPPWTIFPVLPPPRFRDKYAPGAPQPAICAPRFSPRSWLVFFETRVSGSVFLVLLRTVVWLRRELRSVRQGRADDFLEDTSPHVLRGNLGFATSGRTTPLPAACAWRFLSKRGSALQGDEHIGISYNQIGNMQTPRRHCASCANHQVFNTKLLQNILSIVDNVSRSTASTLSRQICARNPTARQLHPAILVAFVARSFQDRCFRKGVSCIVGDCGVAAACLAKRAAGSGR